MTRRFLVTGGAGFIGSNFIRELLAGETDVAVTNVDALTYAGVEATLDILDHDDRHTFVHGDIRDADLVHDVMPGHDVVVNFAAESHVDRSIDGPRAFLETNVVGCGVLLEAARRHTVPRFIQVSTDEVYGSIVEGSTPETAPLEPSSPYSASKAASDLLAGSYAATYDYGVIVTRCTNNFGPFQYPEKIIPLFITNLLEGKPLPVYGDGSNEREWLHVSDHCAALRLLVDEGVPGEIYNIGAGRHLSNLELTRRIVSAMGADEAVIEFVPDRPGHDLRYAVDSSKVRALGWRPRHDIEDDLESTIDWYRANEAWWRPLKEQRS